LGRSYSGTLATWGWKAWCRSTGTAPPYRAIAELDQGQEPEAPGNEARQGRLPQPMTTVKLYPHEESYEVRYSDDRPSVYFYHDDNPGRRSINGRPSPEVALEQAKAFARKERERLAPRR
jgi:hypothetical protein